MEGGALTEWLTIAQAAERVGREEGTVRRWIRQGELSQVLGRVRVRELLEVEALMRERALRFARRPRERRAVRREQA